MHHEITGVQCTGNTEKGKVICNCLVSLSHIQAPLDFFPSASFSSSLLHTASHLLPHIYILHSPLLFIHSTIPSSFPLSLSSLPSQLPTYQPAIRGDPVLRAPQEGWVDPRHLWFTLLMAGTREREVIFVVPQGCM